MKPKRPIDHLRDSAGSMNVGTEEEGSITEVVKFNDRLFVIKEKAVYEVKMADDIDPERINPNIPDSQQRIFTIGSNDRLLGCTILTAHKLFQPKFLPGWVNCEAAMETAFCAMHELVEADNIRESLNGKIASEINRVENIQLNPGLEIPSTSNLESKIKTFLNRIHHFIKTILDITRLFYEGKIESPDYALKHIKYSNEADSNILQIFEDVVPTLRLLWEARNTSEHPKEDKYIKINDFKMNVNGDLKPPTIEIIHPEEALSECPVCSFLDMAVNKVTEIFEILVVYLCGAHAKFGNFPIGVMSLPEDWRQKTHVRFSYAIKRGDDWEPLG